MASQQSPTGDYFYILLVRPLFPSVVPCCGVYLQSVFLLPTLPQYMVLNVLSSTFQQCDSAWVEAILGVVRVTHYTSSNMGLHQLHQYLSPRSLLMSFMSAAFYNNSSSVVRFWLVLAIEEKNKRETKKRKHHSHFKHMV